MFREHKRWSIGGLSLITTQNKKQKLLAPVHKATGTNNESRDPGSVLTSHRGTHWALGFRNACSQEVHKAQPREGAMPPGGPFLSPPGPRGPMTEAEGGED